MHEDENRKSRRSDQQYTVFVPYSSVRPLPCFHAAAPWKQCASGAAVAAFGAPAHATRTHRWSNQADPIVHGCRRLRSGLSQHTRCQGRATAARTLALDVAAWLEAGQWRTPADDLVRDIGDLPVAGF